MVLPNFTTDPNIENNVNRLLEKQPLPETKISPPQTERMIEISETKKEEKEPSSLPAGRQAPEAAAGKKEGLLDELKASKRQKNRPNKIPQARDEITLKVEKIMEAGLQDAYREMLPVQQQEFKIKGEKTAIEIRDLLRAGKVKIKKIIHLLISWLRLLPGVNKFFLEQEAKIKADKIISLKKF